MTIQEFTPEELAAEEWRDVVGYDGYYSVSNLGRVRRDAARLNPQDRSSVQGRILKPSTNSPYNHIYLCHNGHRLSVSVHSLVIAAFIGPRPLGMQINHKDTDKKNNRLGNLEYMTPSENTRHAHAAGIARPPGNPPGQACGKRNGTYTHPETRHRGEKNGNSKLTANNVQSIRSLYVRNSKEFGLKALARVYGVSHVLIANIVNRTTWKHI